jgi:hypothetical protein
MAAYTCAFCSYSTTRSNDYEKHCDTKKHKLTVEKLAESKSKLAEVSPKVAESKSKLAENKGYECKYCGQSYKHKQSVTKHIKYSCTKSNDEDLKELVRLLNLQVESQNKQIDKLMNKLQIQKMQNCFNNNTVNNTTNHIKILAYKDTDLSHLTEKDYVFCIKQVNFCVKSMIEKVHFNPDKPENMNIYISNLKDKYLMVYDGNWNLKNKKDELDTLYENNEMLLEQWLDEEQHKYPELKNKFERYLENKESDETLNRIKEDIKLMMYNKARQLVKVP